MESSAYPMLFSPIKVGTTEVKNRVFMPPVSTNLADHGYVTDDLVDHYRARAKGGVGLIITEVVTVEPTYTYLPGDMCCYDDTFIPGWEKLAAAVHEYGCKIMPQLFHPAYMAFNIPGTPRLIAPSFVGPSYAREAPRPITVDEIHELTHQFGDAAVRMQKAGVDGVEVHAAHAHGMLGGFLTPLYNKRTDEYGGSLPNRMRFLRMCLDEVMETAARRNMAVLVKHNMEDGFKGGIEIPESLEIARAIETYGVDGIVLSSGFVSKAPMAVMRGIIPLYTMSYYMQWWLRIFVRLFGRYMIKQYPFEECFFLENAKKFRAELKLPLVYVGGLVSREGIERALDSGFELVQMARALVNDPAFVDKLREGDRSTRSACDHRNYCIARMYSLDMQCCKHCPDLPRKIREELAKLP